MSGQLMRLHDRSYVVAALAMFSVFVCDAGTITAQTQKLPDIAAPTNGTSAWISRGMRLNGVPMTIKQFTSHANAAEVLHEYERTLRTSADMKTRRTQETNWHVLAVMTGDYYATIRVRDTAHGAEGTITVTPPLARAKPLKRTRFPHPRTAQIVSLQEYDDAGVEAEHISFVSRRSVAIEAREFAALLSKAGWQLLRDEAGARPGGGHVIEAQKSAQLAFINVRRAERGAATTILVVWRKA